MVDLTPEILCRPDDQLGEGPLWDHRCNRLLWVDILRGLVHSWTAGAGWSDLLRVDALIGSVALAGERDLLLATSGGLLRWTSESGELTLLVNPITGRPLRFNDGRVDAAGRFWVGTMALDPANYAEPWGELYRYDGEGGLERMEVGLTLSNGLDWSPDGRTLYLTDTMRRVIYAYDFEPRAGMLSNRRSLITLAETDGYPDGLVVDSSGHIWSACFGAGVVHRYDRHGVLQEKVWLPVSCPTAITFGGSDLATAFITTSRHVLAPDHEEADAGSVLKLSLGAKGRRNAIFGQRQ